MPTTAQRLLVLTIATCALGAATAGSTAAQAPYSCGSFPSCNTYVSGWVSVPAQGQGAAFYQQSCPSSGEQLAAGVSFQAGAAVQVFAGVQNDPSGVLNNNYILNALGLTGSVTSVQSTIGCVAPGTPSGFPASASAAGKPKARVRSIRVRPSRRHSVTVRCASGRRLRDGGGAVIFHTTKRPSRALLRDHKIKVRKARDRVNVTVRTGRHTGDDERVELQTVARCA